LEAEFSECETDSVDSITTTTPSSKPHHCSMEGGLDNSCLLSIGSPKLPDSENKENNSHCDEVDFIRPRIPTPKKKLLAGVNLSKLIS